MVHHVIPELITRKQHHMVHHVIPELITRKQHHMVHHVIPQLITRKQHHMVHHVIPQLITRKQHHMVSPCDSTINHKQTTSHGAQDISQCIMEFYIQLTPLNNYSSNYVIKLPMKLLTPNLPLSNSVIKLHTKLEYQVLARIVKKRKKISIF
jgi:hypothetical protein